LGGGKPFQPPLYEKQNGKGKVVWGAKQKKKRRVTPQPHPTTRREMGEGVEKNWKREGKGTKR